ncbi:MAG TPA: SRPBCC family protein [Bryobacteraceae bacterium]|jgi:hypothetical protein
MKWILFAVIAIAAVVLLVALLGLTLPVSHVVSRRARFRESPQVVFDAITGPSNWRSDVVRVETLPPVDGHERWKEFGKHGDGVTYELVESTRPLRRVTRIADEGLPYSGGWTFEIAPAPGGSTLKITERGEVINPIFRFVSRYVIGHYRTIDTYLTDLAKKFGQPVQFEK